MQDLAVQLWLEIARRFGDRNEVAAYSLLAEPFGAPSAEARDAMYDRLVKAAMERNRAFFDGHAKGLPYQSMKPSLWKKIFLPT